MVDEHLVLVLEIAFTLAANHRRPRIKHSLLLDLLLLHTRQEIPRPRTLAGCLDFTPVIFKLLERLVVLQD